MINIKESLDYGTSENAKKLIIREIQLDFYYTEKEQEQNSKRFDSMSYEEWGEHCKKTSAMKAEKIKTVTDIIKEKYKTTGRDYDVYLWTCDDGSTSTLTINYRNNVEYNIWIMDSLLNGLQNYLIIDFNLQIWVKKSDKEYISKRIAEENGK